VGNQVGGFEDQPDYDAEAEWARDIVQPHMPTKLPSAETACASMLDAVAAHYDASEGEGSQAVRLLGQTRTQDAKACREETSPAAASCVVVIVRREGLEYARALDLCTRAFPK
jgi:hypothetical protein